VVRVHGPPARMTDSETALSTASRRWDDASGDLGAHGPRQDGSREYRAARWPSNGGMTPPAIRVRTAPARWQPES
jgi:hypothetical protein